MKRVLTCVFALGVAALLASMLPAACRGGRRPRGSRGGDVLPSHPAVPDVPEDGRLLRGSRQGRIRQTDQGRQGRVPLHRLPGRRRTKRSTKGYKVGGPTLIVARVAGNKVAEYKNLTEIWSKVGDKSAFIDYVQTNVKDYQK